jgi:type VI secretion system secreted protein Hcp
MAYDAFVTFEGKSDKDVEIKGESTDADSDFKGKAFEVYSFSFGASNPVRFGSQSEGAGAGKVSISSFNLMKKVDASSPPMFLSCANGGHFSSATVTLRKSGGAQVKYLIFKLSPVFVESVQWSGSSGGDDTPTESVSLAFGKVDITYTRQDNKGAAMTPQLKAKWNVQTNTPD